MLKRLNDSEPRHPIEDSKERLQDEVKTFLLKHMQRAPEESVRQTQVKTQAVVVEHVKESSQNSHCRQDNVLDAKVKAILTKYAVRSVSGRESHTKKEIEEDRLVSPTDVSLSIGCSTPNLGPVRDVLSPLSSIPGILENAVQIARPSSDALFSSFTSNQALSHWSRSPSAFDGEAGISQEVVTLEGEDEEVFPASTLGRNDSKMDLFAFFKSDKL